MDAISRKSVSASEKEVDPITLEVIRNKLEAVANEMQATLLRSAVSVIVKEGEDCSCGLFSATGDTIAQAAASPLHLAVMPPTVRAVLQAYPAETMREGDVFLMNDPYGGGTHCPDFLLVYPVFHREALISFSVALAHQEDVGGKNPGSMSADSTEIWQDGFIIPPTRIYERGVPNRTFFDLLEKNVRLPDVLFGDLQAQLAAGKVGARGIGKLVETFGIETFGAALRELDVMAEQMMCAGLAAIEDGESRWEDWLDHDGIDTNTRIKIACRVNKKGTRIQVDFSGTDPQVMGPVNVNKYGAISACLCAIRSVCAPEAPTCEGAHRSIEVIAPEGTILNPRHPAPVGLRAQTVKRVADIVLAALASLAPGKVPAGSGGSLSVVSFGGFRPDGSRFGCTDLMAGGTGARPTKDGIDFLESDISNSLNVPAEALEAGYPIRVLRTELIPDSGGAGRTRGGLGVRREYEVTRGPIQSCYRSDRHHTRSWGLYGGLAGASFATYVRRASGTLEPVNAKAILRLDVGDVLVVETGGGGGYGDPLERPPELVLEDLENGKISAEAARDLYGVVVNTETFTLDHEATVELRGKLARARGTIRWMYDSGVSRISVDGRVVETSTNA